MSVKVYSVRNQGATSVTRVTQDIVSLTVAIVRLTMPCNSSYTSSALITNAIDIAS